MFVCVYICIERKEDRSHEKPVVGKAKSVRRKSSVRVPATRNGLSGRNILIILRKDISLGNVSIISQMHTNIERKVL